MNEKDLIDIPKLLPTEPFFNLSHDLLCIAGYDGYFKKVNPAVLKVLGYTKKELFSRPIDDFIHKGDQSQTEKNRKSLLAGNPLLHFENRYITKTGETVWLSWTSMPIESEKLVYAIAKDITYKKKLEEERTQLIDQLTEVNEEIKRISYTTSHDLRAPVNNLLALIGILDETPLPTKEAEECFHHLKMSAQQIKHTLDNYLDNLSQQVHSQATVENINIEKVLDMVLKTIGSLIESSNASIQFDFSAFNSIPFNEAYLESILLNLLTNSIKYANPDNTPSIKISTREKGGSKQLVFTDNGMGFDMDKVKGKIFGLNQTFHQHGDSKGVGLYLIYNHVTSLGGKVDVQSKVNEGTTFTITFED